MLFVVVEYESDSTELQVINHDGQFMINSKVLDFDIQIHNTALMVHHLNHTGTYEGL